MNLLAIETSTDACSVALRCGGETRVDHRLEPRRHAQLVLPMIDALLAEAGLARAALDGVAFGRGPGSFTGVRIAASVTQGIALGLDIGVVGVSTLATLAQGCLREHGDARVGVALDARLDEIYWGAFRATEGGVVRPCTAERVCAARTVTVDDGGERGHGEDGDAEGESGRSAQGDGGRGDWRLVGPGAERYLDTLASALGPDVRVASRPGRWPDARDTLALAEVAVAARGLEPAERAVPVYLRERVALTEAERGVAPAAGPDRGTGRERDSPRA